MLLYFFITFAIYYFFILLVIYGWHKINGPGGDEHRDDIPKISVVVAVRNEEKNKRDGEKIYRADIYIFAIQTAKSDKEFDPLNLSQWVFYILRKKELEKRNTQSISLNVIKKLTNPINYVDLKSEFYKLA